MLTREQILNCREFHVGECARTIGPKGGVTTKCEVWRRSGKTKTWKREPARFRIPVKHGLRNHGHIELSNVHIVHAAEDCPLSLEMIGDKSAMDACLEAAYERKKAKEWKETVKIREWIETRGGVHCWSSCNLSDPGAKWMVPVRNADGTPSGKPHWGAGEIFRTLTTLDDAEVVCAKLVKRFHVGVRLGSQGMMFKVTDGGSRRIRRECANAGDDSWYEFAYDTQDALIFAPASVVPLRGWNA